MSAKEALAAHQRHLVRKVTHAMQREGLPDDLLTESAVEARFCGATGFPEAADSVAYEPTQGLLAVGTSDGRVVLIGRPGVEFTLRSASRSPTQHLCFLPHKGALLRVTQDGDCQLFSAVSRRLLTSIWLQGDTINSVTLLPGSDPYVLLGCESGNVRVVALLDEDGRPAAGAKPAADLAVQPYQVLGQEVDGKSGVVAVAVAHLRDRPLLLLVHRHSGALIWDIRQAGVPPSAGGLGFWRAAARLAAAERILCAAIDAEDEHSKPTCACWVGERANCFAVGYDDGSILVWGVPPMALQGDPFKVIEPPDARLLMTLRVAGRGVHAAAVRSLSFMPGGGGAGAAEDCLLVFGGQGQSEPDMLALLPLTAQPDGDGGGRQVPWFGNIKGLCTMPAQGALSGSERPRGLMILTEGGQLVVHDLASWQPTPLTLPIQELPPITVSAFVPTVSVALLAEPGGSAAVSPRSPKLSAASGGAGGGGAPSPSPRGGGPASASAAAAAAGTAAAAGQALPQHALTLDRVRACSRRAGQQAGDAGAGGSHHHHSLPDHWPFSGGEPACSMAAGGGGGGDAAAGTAKRHPSALYFTGHRDGRVRVWDATVQVPELLLTVPATAGQERLRAVTAMEVCPFSGIVIVGHQGGDVRLYQFTESAQSVQRMNIDETLLPYGNVGHQAGGFQYIMRYSTHSADVTAVALATKLKLAAVTDAGGNLSLLDLLQPAQLFSTRAMSQPVAQLVFGSHVIPGPTKEDPGVERVVLFLAGADSSACMVGLDRGEPIGRPMRPKNASRPLAMALLDPSGIPLPLLHGQLVLHWATNNASGGAAGGTPAAARVSSLKEDDPAVAGRVSRLSLSERPTSTSPLPHATSRRSTGADSHRSWSRADSGEPEGAERESSVEVHELPSDDDDELDSHLAAAVQAVEEEKKAKATKFKLPKAFQRPGSRGSQAATPAPAAAGAGGDAGEAGDLPSPGSDAGSGSVFAAASAAGGSGQSGGEFDPVNALQDFYGPGAGPAPGADPASPGSPTLSAGLQSPPGSRSGGGELLSQADLVDYPYLIDGDPTPAAYLLLCCADYLRLYPADNVRLGDRSTERKASFEAGLCFAAPFMSVHGPGVASVDASDALQVHSLPGLAPLCRRQLEDSRVLGFRWACQPAAAAASCCSLDGQLVLVAPGNEVARLAVVADCALPAAPAAVYSLRVAQAAAAAATARRPAGAGGAAAAGGYPVRVEAPAATATEAGGDDGGSASPVGAGAAAKGFGRFFDQAASTVTGLASTAMQELDRARAAGQTALQRLGTAAAGEAPSRALPPLAVLFATPVEPLEDDLEYMPESDAASEAASSSSGAAPSAAAAAGGAVVAGAAAAAAPPPSAAPPARKAPHSLVSPREAAAKLKNLLPVGRSKSERAELLERDAAAAAVAGGGSSSARSPGGGGGGGWTGAGKDKPGTAAAGAKAGDVRGVMEQNQRMLAERGERLAALDERTAAMQGDAEDFASMARKLAEMQAAKKWYQL
ncbi:hypothetical protein CHLNCDRAFT_137041 [Chlorella variabilis]|uniref:V-SNARE coiled-coil homology domain-containing protein n=1 Tax=Chlorella variabilis TaxID=554065 RepID=E1ZLV0_CHLVA|nr:hypothetical protein CHLNCDRAFT_137041 [Chlorella variabilis]EFN53326.1 hypothetical protein CHLNCDRAFT_137041 [Chlorella variabilis]|eukprot:XP_005845428.1 hypothetical protein CHLNCDRAFT_137041 [Chlorella variabilis]